MEKESGKVSQMWQIINTNSANRINTRHKSIGESLKNTHTKPQQIYGQSCRDNFKQLWQNRSACSLASNVNKVKSAIESQVCELVQSGGRGSGATNCQIFTRPLCTLNSRELDARCPHTHTHSNFLCVCVRLIKRFEWISLKIFANIFPISINSILKGSENYAQLIISIVYLTHSPYTTHPPRVYHKFVRANQYKLAISRFSMSIITKLYDPQLALSLSSALSSFLWKIASDNYVLWKSTTHFHFILLENTYRKEFFNCYFTQRIVQNGKA